MDFIEKLHYVDDRVFGYRFGYFFWLSLFIVNNVVLGVDDTQGEQRDYLTHTSLMSCLTLVVYFYHQFQGNPSSVPAMHGAGTESLARILYASHCGWGNIVGTNTMGAWNCVLLVIAGLFGVSKMGQTIHTNWNRNAYIEYVNREKEIGIR
tara:strand:+ start:287 stop:739 length:453 start_codon:yes stop_codon:yes gene_type:complete